MPTFGPTGRFPYGKLSPQDEGEIMYGVAADPETGIVLLDFGKPIRSLGMRPEEAEALAEGLWRKAKIARKENENG